MGRIFTLISFFSCVGCAELTYKSTPVVDEFSMAAKSWIGAHIEEMISVWPNPNIHCGKNTIGEAGCAWWRYGQSPVADGQVTYGYRCEIIARYNEAGVITRIEIRESDRCDRIFAGQFVRMTRHTEPEPMLTIEELEL